MKTFKNFGEAYPCILNDILTEGKESAPRGMKIKEIIPYSFILESTEKGFPIQKSRKHVYRYGLLEGMLNLYGKQEPDLLTGTVPNMKTYQNSLGLYDGAYPERCGIWLQFILKTLQKDPDSRKAVISIYGPQDKHDTLDTCCNLTWQFLIREGKLHMIVNMRGNDALWGTPYNMQQNIFLMTYMTSWLKIPTGRYIHNVGSMHIYEQHYEWAQQIIDDKEEFTPNFYNPSTNLSYHETMEQISIVINAYRKFLTNGDILSLDLSPDMEYYYKILTKQLGKNI